MTESDKAAEENSSARLLAGRPGHHGRLGIIVGGVLAAVAALALYDARNLPPGTAMLPGPGAAPDILAALLFILGIILAIQSFLRRRSGGGK